MAVIICVAGGTLFWSLWWLLVSVIVFVTIFAATKATGAELTVSPLEFVARGNLGARARTSRVVLSADVRGFEFRDSSVLGGANGGLHTLTDRASTLLLPYLDWEQTQEVIAAIKKKLPGLAENWR